MPWSRVSPLKGQIEKEFLHPLLLGESVAPFGLLEPALAIIPFNQSTDSLLTSDEALSYDYPKLSAWLRKAEKLWGEHSSGNMTLLERWNYHNGLAQQFPISNTRVVYAASGSLPAAAVVRGNQAIVEHKLYWLPTKSEEEALYLAAILNSETVRSEIEGLQSEGQFGQRDFDKVMFTLPIPRHDISNALHNSIASAARNAEAIVASLSLPPSGGFQAKRKAIRSALIEAGSAPKIEMLIGQLLRN
jgi:hypothetical protein